MNTNLPKFSDQQKGIALITLGSILLLYTLNVFKYSGAIIILIAIAMIVYGVLEADLHTYVLGLFKKNK